jgi:predicted transcriptional regulator
METQIEDEKTEAFQLRLSASLRRRLREQAEKDRRTVSNLIRKVLEDWVDTKENQ